MLTVTSAPPSSPSSASLSPWEGFPLRQLVGHVARQVAPPVRWPVCRPGRQRAGNVFQPLVLPSEPGVQLREIPQLNTPAGVEFGDELAGPGVCIECTPPVAHWGDILYPPNHPHLRRLESLGLTAEAPPEETSGAPRFYCWSRTLAKIARTSTRTAKESRAFTGVVLLSVVVQSLRVAARGLWLSSFLSLFRACGCPRLWVSILGPRSGFLPKHDRNQIHFSTDSFTTCGYVRFSAVVQSFIVATKEGFSPQTLVPHDFLLLFSSQGTRRKQVTVGLSGVIHRPSRSGRELDLGNDVRPV